MDRLPAALAFAACLAAGGVSAQERDTSYVARIDPAVEEVVSGGAWKAGQASGTYRLVVITEGWEAIRYRLFLQWLEVPQEPGPITIRKTVELTPLAGMFSLTGPELSLRGGRWYVTAYGADRPLAASSRRVRFELGPPGTVRRVRAP
ncbi:MAG TPA: hypothetical protein VF746_18760 [Longimicrobium sp.]|jgi:hypothetical protein